MDISRLELKKLILGHLAGNLSEEESAFLNKWLEKPKNRKVFERICDGEIILEKAHIFDKFPEEIAWKRLSAKAFRQARIFSIAKYAALFILPLCSGLFLYFRTGQTVSSDESILSVQHHKSDVTLTLSDGSSVVLGKTGTDSILVEGLVLGNSAGVLSYPDIDTSVNLAETYNEVTTAKGGMYKVQLPDGTLVVLNAESSLRFPVQFSQNVRKVRVSGELYFDVKYDAQRPFIVESDYSTVEVLGTQFNVKAYTDFPNEVTLVSGKIQMQKEDNKLVLVPGQQAVLEVGRKEFKVKTVDVLPYIAWSENRFLFDNTSLEEIMYDLEKWYGVNVFFENDAARKECFSLDLSRNSKLEEVVSLLEKTGTVTVTLKEGGIFINK
ncbi:MAG: FecR family protein [Odoribacter splanchnicus]